MADINIGIFRKIKNKEKFKELLNEWAQNSTSHGLPNVIRNKLLIIRVIWFLFFICSLCLCGYMIINNVNEYLQYDVTTKTRVKQLPYITFPRVTICNSNIMITKIAQEYIRVYMYENYNQTFDSFSEMSSYFGYEKLSNIFNVLFEKILKPDFNLTLKKSFGFTSKEMIFNCYYDNKPCNYSQISWYYDYEFGNCYRFNWGIDKYGDKISLYNLSKAGGLYLELFTGIPESYFNYMHQQHANGIRLVIDDENLNPITDQNLLIMPGVYAKLKTNKVITTNLPIPYSHCVDPETFLLPMIKFMKSFGVYYNRADCIRYCIQKQIVERFECYYLKYPEISKHISPCLEEKTLGIMDRYVDENMELCSKDCPFVCQSTMYDLRVSYSKFPSKNYADQLIIWGKLNKIYEDIEPNYEIFKQSLSSVEFFYSDFKVTEITEQESYSIIKLISDIGGTLGLFIGVSVLSFVEIVDLAIKIFISIIKLNPRISSRK